MSSVVLAELTAICITVLRRKVRCSSTQLNELLRNVRSETNREPVTAATRSGDFPQSKPVTGL